MLQRMIAANLPAFRGGVQAIASRSAGARAALAPALAQAFGTTFWFAAALIAVTIVPAILLPGPRQQDRRAAPLPPNERHLATCARSR